MRKSDFKSLILIGVVLFFAACSNSNRVYTITDFGAKSDNEKINTESIQKSIDLCAEKGGGKVVVPKGQFITGTLFLKSKVNLHIEEGGELIGSTNIDDYSRENRGAIEAPAFDECLIYAEDATDISLSGKGLINGRGYKQNFPEYAGDTLGDRPMLIRFDHCKKIKIQDISLMNAASWCVHMVDCDSILAQNVNIDSHVNKNNDGFDLDGCKNAIFEGCTINTGDDSFCPKSTTDRLCENIVINNCKATSQTAAFKCGTSSKGGF